MIYLLKIYCTEKVSVLKISKLFKVKLFHHIGVFQGVGFCYNFPATEHGIYLYEQTSQGVVM